MTVTMRTGCGNNRCVYSLLSLCLIVAMSLPRTFADGVYRLVLVHTNNMHSKFHPVDENGMPCSSKSADVTKCYGGFARVKKAVDKERERAGDTAFLYLDAGGSIQNPAPHTYFNTKSMANLMMKLKPNAISLGSKEFEDGLVNIKNFIGNIDDIPILCSNIDVSEEPLLNTETKLKRSVIITIKGRRIGIIGYLTPKTGNSANEYMGHVKIKPEKAEIQKEVNYMKTIGVNIIIALGHSGIETDKMIAQEINGIDIVVGGYSCTFLYEGAIPSRDKPYKNSYPLWVDQPSDSALDTISDFFFSHVYQKSSRSASVS